MAPRKTAAPKPKKAAERKLIDWEKIEDQFRVGKLSIRAIALENGITDTAIRRRAKEQGWQRDLSDKVRRAVRRQLVRTSVRVRTDGEQREHERDVVEAAAAEGVAVILKHQSFLARMLALGDKMLSDLELRMASGESSSELVATLESLSRIASRALPQEREAHNLNEKGGGSEHEKWLNQLAEAGI